MDIKFPNKIFISGQNKENLNHIFNRYTRASRETTELATGVGNWVGDLLTLTLSSFKHAHAHAHAIFISTTTKPLPDSATNTDYDTLTLTASSQETRESFLSYAVSCSVVDISSISEKRLLTGLINLDSDSDSEQTIGLLNLVIGQWLKLRTDILSISEKWLRLLTDHGHWPWVFKHISMSI
jgi:hypothetical protein